ncbi:MAG: hypothetical protein HY828_02115 [Actinobacteria bacterium]|nr:hypothetical protein [Actinomycetota bacterium]
MNAATAEQRVVAAFAAARSNVRENPDLFERVQLSMAEARERRRFRLRLAGALGTFILANAALALALSDFDNGRFTMHWWVIELITNIVLIALAIGLGPFIKRFGRSYAADVFRANPRTGKSYLVLTDVAYYLIFTSFVLFTVTFVAPPEWLDSTGAQLKHEVARVGGILLIMGVLHALNVVALPVIGGLLATNRRRDVAQDEGPSPSSLGPGTWLLRIEPAGGAAAEPPTD